MAINLKIIPKKIKQTKKSTKNTNTAIKNTDKKYLEFIKANQNKYKTKLN